MKKISVILTVFILGFVVYILNYKRNPFEIMDDHKIYLNRGNKVLEFEDDWGGIFNIHGNGITVVRILIDKEPFKKVIEQIDKSAYKEFPVLPSDDSKIPLRFLKNLGKKGYYVIKSNSDSERSFCIFDSTNKEIILYYELL